MKFKDLSCWKKKHAGAQILLLIQLEKRPFLAPLPHKKGCAPPHGLSFLLPSLGSKIKH